MNLLIYGDIQATDGNEMCWADATVTLQHYRVMKFFTDLKAIYKKYKCQGVIDLGDTTDDRSSIPVPTIDVLGAGMSLIPDSDFNFKLVGNHEQYLRNTAINNRRLFEHKFTVIDQNNVYEIEDLIAVFCSYPASHDDLAKWLAESQRGWASPKVCFGHFQTVGCTLSGGKSLSGVPLEVLEQFDLTFLGHIHLPHSVTDSIHYVGSPFQQDWGEAGQKKRVAILDTVKLSVTWVPLPGYPEYRQVQWKDFKDLQDIGEHRYRVLLSSHEETEAFFQHVYFQKAEPVYNYDAVAATDKAESQDWSFEGTCRRYIDLVPPTAVSIDMDKDELLGIGTDLAKGQL